MTDNVVSSQHVRFRRRGIVGSNPPQCDGFKESSWTLASPDYNEYLASSDGQISGGLG